MIYDRKNRTLTEHKEYRQGLVTFLYETVMGRVILRVAVSPFVSKMWGFYQNTPLSKRGIKPFVEKNNVQISQEEICLFHSFNDFFTRQKQFTPQTDEKDVLLSIADSKLRYYKITSDLKLKLKNCTYDIADILGDEELAKEYQNGTCIVFRLGTDDYHHYHFFDEGKCVLVKIIKGQLHTVRSISEKHRVFARNSRHVSILETANFGKVVQIEIGALLVGKIKNRPISTFTRMEEKGYFEFGGSTVVLLLNKPIAFDEDIEKMNADGIETKVCVGERIGILC